MAIGFDNIGCVEAVAEYEKRGVVTFERVASSLYSSRMLNSFGIKEVVRVSPLHCHDVNDIDEFLKITKEMSLL